MEYSLTHTLYVEQRPALDMQMLIEHIFSMVTVQRYLIGASNTYREQLMHAENPQHI